MNPYFVFTVQNVVLPLVITLGTLYFDQRWHAIQAYNHAYAKAVSLGVDSRRHPDKVTLEAMFMAQEAELEYVAENLKKDVNQVFRDLEADIADRLMEHAFRGKAANA
jgi:hypothetical protein